MIRDLIVAVFALDTHHGAYQANREEIHWWKDPESLQDPRDQDEDVEVERQTFAASRSQWKEANRRGEGPPLPPGDGGAQGDPALPEDDRDADQARTVPTIGEIFAISLNLSFF